MKGIGLARVVDGLSLAFDGDRTDGQPPLWPTLGIPLTMRADGGVQTTDVSGTVSLALALVETMLEACDARHIDDPVSYTHLTLPTKRIV